jgi:phosphoribosylformylglycinamidine cyclo-ligase
MREAPGTPLTYGGAGVPRGLVAESLRELLAEIRYRAPPKSGRPLPLRGHYAGLLRIGAVTLAVTTDTVGTKTILAEQLGRWEEVGEDLVAINVNDLASVGARPAGLVDTISVAHPDPAVFRALGRGINRGLARARCSLLGGETAVVPELLRSTDLGATAIGFFPPGRRPVTGARIRPGDLLLGIPASGLHANGFTLARRIVAKSGAPLAEPRPGATGSLGEEMLTPTRTYVEASEVAAALPTTTGLAHISGGGVRNLIRLNARVRFTLDAWPEPSGIFRWLAEAGGIGSEEMFQTFNMGIGFVIATRASGAEELRRRWTRAGLRDAQVVGRVERGSGVHLPHLGLSYDRYA